MDNLTQVSNVHTQKVKKKTLHATDNLSKRYKTIESYQSINCLLFYKGSHFVALFIF